MKIEELRSELNKLIEDNAEYDVILKKSQELDELIDIITMENVLSKKERKKIIE